MVESLWRSRTCSTANWSGVSYSPDITFEEDGSGAHQHYAADILSWNRSGGSEPIEGIKCFGNKTITVEKPQEDFEVEFDVIFTDTTFTQMIFGGTLSSGAIVSGTEYKTTGSKKRWRIIITYQDDTKTEQYRVIFKDVFAISWEPEHTADDYLKGKIRFKVSPTDKSGVANIIEEYLSTGTLTTLAAAHGGVEDSYAY